MTAFFAQHKLRSFPLLLIIITGITLGLISLFVAELSTRMAAIIIISISLPLILLVVGNVRKVLLAIILLDIPFQIDTFIFGRWGLQQTGAINGYGISLTLICLIGLYTLWALEFAVNQQRERRSFVAPSLPIVLFLIVLISSEFVAIDNTLALFEIFLIGQVFLLYFYVINNVRSRSDLTFILAILLLGLLLEGLIFLLLIIRGQNIELAGLTAVIFTGSGEFRVGGTLQSPNGAGSYLVTVSVITFSMLFTSLPSSYKRLAGIAFVTGLVALVTTFSRGAWLACVLSFGIFGLVAWRRSWINLKVLIISLFVVTLLLVTFNQAILARLAGDDAGSAIGRIPQYLMALRMIQDHPILGVGANNYIIHFNQYLSPEYRGTVFHWVVHNKYLLVWAEIGTLGLLTFVWFLMSAVQKGFRLSTEKDALLAPLALGFAVAIIGQMIHMFLDIFHSRPQVQLLWLVIALITCIEIMQKFEQNGASRDYRN